VVDQLDEKRRSRFSSMRFVVLDVFSAVPREVSGSSVDAVRARLFRRGGGNVCSMLVRRADNYKAAVVAYGRVDNADDIEHRHATPENGEYEALLKAESSRRGYTPSEFVWCAPLRGTILLVVESADGTHSFTARQYNEVRAGARTRLKWLERPSTRRLAPIAESPQRVNVDQQ